MEWTEQRIETLRKLWGQGQTASQIAAILGGVTRNAVIGKARDFLIGFARSTPGVWFDCLDGEPAHLFFVMVAPPYNDISYLRIYKSLAEAFSIRDLRREFMEAQSEGEVLRAIKRMGQG